VAAMAYEVYNLNIMSKRLPVYAILLLLFMSMTANAFGWVFNSKVLAHELDHIHHVLSPDPAAHLGAHHHGEADEDHLDAATHLSLHAAGQYQPFFFMPPLVVPASGATQVLMAFISAQIPDSVLDSPLHPPRSILAA
jgi:hypothetical protein